jgi:hypothetical protein
MPVDKFLRFTDTNYLHLHDCNLYIYQNLHQLSHRARAEPYLQVHQYPKVFNRSSYISVVNACRVEIVDAVPVHLVFQTIGPMTVRASI